MASSTKDSRTESTSSDIGKLFGSASIAVMRACAVVLVLADALECDFLVATVADPSDLRFRDLVVVSDIFELLCCGYRGIEGVG